MGYYNKYICSCLLQPKGSSSSSSFNKRSLKQRFFSFSLIDTKRNSNSFLFVTKNNRRLSIYENQQNAINRIPSKEGRRTYSSQPMEKKEDSLTSSLPTRMLPIENIRNICVVVKKGTINSIRALPF